MADFQRKDASGGPGENQLRKGMSVLVQDSHMELTGAALDKAAHQCLARAYHAMKKVQRKRRPSELEPILGGDQEHSDTSSSAEISDSPELDAGGPDEILRDLKQTHASSKHAPFPCRSVSFSNSLQQRGQLHLQSADLFESFSPVQKERQLWQPSLPDVFSGGPVVLEEVDAPELPQGFAEELKKTHPHTFNQPCLLIRAGETALREYAESGRLSDNFGADEATVLDEREQCGPDEIVSDARANLLPDRSGGIAEPVPAQQSAAPPPRRALRVGIILSGGPAPGGHNVIAGVYDYMKNLHVESQLFGFMGGLDGLFQKKYRVVTDDLMLRFRNQGGFDMLWSGRGRVNGKDDLSLAARVCLELDLQGLIIVGGDGSNSNAALLAEYFAVEVPNCSVIGVPKTIDGDLRNPWIETSFGFDTAAKTYSELIGNLCTDVTTAQQFYHFVRVMGRSASHLVLECALQTRPNIVFIGEEIERDNVCLSVMVNEIVDLIIKRKEMNKHYGIILVPEGLIEFVPEMKLLIGELNEILVSDFAGANAADLSMNDEQAISSQVREKLSERARGVWDFLPGNILSQLLTDREATGYIQVAKIATERLLQTLVFAELQRRATAAGSPRMFADIEGMTHYFGYEGRCAMPSNFDASYCYSLGYTAGCLIDHKKNGYVSVVRHLEQHASWWQPGGIPLTRIMEMKEGFGVGAARFPAVKRQLVDLNGPLFKVLCEVREFWKLGDYYRCPGPIQFEGPVSDIADYTVAVPTKEDLLGGSSPELLVGVGRAVCPKRPGCLSELQKQRLQHRPSIPSICKNVHARALPHTQYLPKDPYTQRQILVHYPYLCNSNRFHLQEVGIDSNTPPVGAGLKVGIVFLSRQSPGVINVLWGLQERMKLVKGKCVGFYGTEGLLEGRCLEIVDSDLQMYLNQGGMEILGRPAKHSLLEEVNQEKARQSCEKLHLDGLVIVGSSLAITEAAMTAEYFLKRGCRTSVIGIPATGSNNLTHDLIETNIGFDTSSKLYASLIGNVLTDAASMPKYWHFVRLMGRQPSNEVLECALQTHPNICIIAEEYGAANRTLWDVVIDICDVVCARAAVGKNFGSVLIPDGLLSHLPNMKTLMTELTAVVREADRQGELSDLQAQLDAIDDPLAAQRSVSPTNDGTNEKPQVRTNWAAQITPWSLALFASLPRFIRRELTQTDIGEMRFTLIETELLLSQLVKEELQRRKEKGEFRGKFASVCHFFGYQGRSSMPSQFDCSLAFAYGHLAGICVESGLTGHCCTIRGLVGEKEDWKLSAIPFNAMLNYVATQDDVHPVLREKRADVPIIPSAEVDLNCKAYRWLKTAVGQWQLQDRFCNPGPVQFCGKAAGFFHRILHEEQAEYFNMLTHVQFYSTVLRNTCTFGVEEAFLKAVFTNLHSLLVLRFHPDDLMGFLPPLADLDQYEQWHRNKGTRPEVWLEQRQPQQQPQSGGSGIDKFEKMRTSLVGFDRPAATGQIAFPGCTTTAGNLVNTRLQSSSCIGDDRLSSLLPHGAGLQNGPGPKANSSARIDSILMRHNTLTDAGWGEMSAGVEAYPRTTRRLDRK